MSHRTESLSRSRAMFAALIALVLSCAPTTEPQFTTPAGPPSHISPDPVPAEKP